VVRTQWDVPRLVVDLIFGTNNHKEQLIEAFSAKSRDYLLEANSHVANEP
jgi:hypothetical protein